MGDVGAVLGVSPCSAAFSGGVTSVVSEESHKLPGNPGLLGLYYSLDSLAGVLFVDEPGSSEFRILLITLHDE